MSEKNIAKVVFERSPGTALSEQAQRDLEAVRVLPDEDIDVSDIPPLPAGWRKHARRFDEVFRARKEAISLRIDADVLLWLRAGGNGYQSRINAILRERMNAESRR